MDDHRREQNVVSSIARSFRCTGPAFVTGDVTARAASLAAAATRFAAQDLLATTAQLAECGVTSGVLRQRLATGEWIRIERELVGIPAPMTWERRVRGAVLLGGASALVSHGTAARLHRFDGYDRFDEICLCWEGSPARARKANGCPQPPRRTAARGLVCHDRAVASRFLTLADVAESLLVAETRLANQSANAGPVASRLNVNR